MKSNFPEIDMNEIFSSSIKGKINLSGMWGFILDIFGDEILARNL